MRNSCRVQFSFEKKTGKQLVFSLPQTNHYQEIRNLSLEPKTPNLIFDEWGNTVACFSLNDVDNAKIEFLYTPESVGKSLEKNWTIYDYKTDKQIQFFNTPDRFINGEDAKIKKLSQSLIKKEQNVFKIAHSFYDFILDYLSYGNPTEGLYRHTQALEEKVTDCGGFSTLLLSLFQSMRIPGRLVVGFLVKENIIHKLLSTFNLFTKSDLVSLLTFNSFIMHAWIEILLPDNTWFPLDPSVEWRRNHNQSKRNGGFGKIPADRLVTSFGQDFTITIDGKKYRIDLLQLPIYL